MAERCGWIEQFLAADFRDVGCDATRAVLHFYVELLTAEVVAADYYPGVAAHVAACQSCMENMLGLAAAVAADHHRRGR